MASNHAVSEEYSIQEMQEEQSIHKMYISNYNLHCLNEFIPFPAVNSLTIYSDIHKTLNSSAKQYLNQSLQTLAENAQILKLKINRRIPFQVNEEKNISILPYLQNFKNLHDLDIQIGDKTKLDTLAINQFLSLSANKLKKLRIELRTEILKQNAGDSQFALRNMFIAMDNLIDLTIIIAENNNLKEKGAIQLAQGIAKYQGLQKLDLKIGEFNQVSSQGIKAIMKSIVQMNKLKDFSFEISDTNNLGTDGIICIIQMIEGFIYRGDQLKLNLADRKGIISNALKTLFEAFSKKSEQNKQITLRHLEIIINSQQIFNSNAFLNNTFAQCFNLESLDLGILAKIEVSQQINPICNLISSITILQQLRRLNLIIPGEVKFDLEAIAFLGTQIKLLTQMQSLRISIGESNSLKKVIKKKKKVIAVTAKDKKTAQSDQKEESIVKEVKEDILAPQPKQACLRNILEGISSLNQLEKLDLEIHKDNYLDDEGWECLGNIENLRELRIKLSSGCGISDMSLHGLAKAISNLANLKGLQLDFDEEIEISRKALVELFENPRRQQMKKYQSLSLTIGKHIECGDELLVSLSQSLVFSVDSLTKLSLGFEGSNGISNKGTIQLFDFIQGLTQLHVLSLRFGERNEICNDSLAKLNTSIENLKHLQEIDISFFSASLIGVKAQLGLYGIVAILSLQELSNVNIVMTSKELLEIVTHRKIKKQIDQQAFCTKSSFNYFFSNTKLLPKLVVNTPQGIQCNLSLNNLDSLVELPDGLKLLPQNLTEYVLTLPSPSGKAVAKAKNTKKYKLESASKFSSNTINDNLSKFSECVSNFLSCSKLNISLPDYLIEELSFDQLTAGIGKMQFLSELKLHAKAVKLSLTAAQQLASLMFLEYLTLELELSQKYPSTEAITVILRPLFISKYLKVAQVSVQSFSSFNLKIIETPEQKEVIPITQNLSENQCNLKCILEVSQVAKTIPSKDDTLYHIGRLLSIATIPYSTIRLTIKGDSQLDTQSMDEFAKGLAMQTSLAELGLEFATVPAEGVISLTECFKALSKLRKIALSIESDESFSLGPALATMDNLMSLFYNTYSRKITINGSVVLSNCSPCSSLVPLMDFNSQYSCIYYLTLFTPIENTKRDHSNCSELSTVVRILKLQQKKNTIDRLFLNSTEILGNWQQFEFELDDLEQLFITDSFFSVPSLRSFSLESMLAKLPKLRRVSLHLSCKKKQDSNLTSIQVEEQAEESQLYPLFGSQLKNLNQITQLDLNLEDFSFGEDATGAGLCEGINGIKNSLSQISIKFTKQSLLKSEGLINLSAVIGSSSNLKTVCLEFLINEQNDYLVCIEILRQFKQAKNILSLQVQLTLAGDKGNILLAQGINQVQRNYLVKFNHLGTEWGFDLPGKDIESMKKNNQYLLQLLDKSWQEISSIEVTLDYLNRQKIARSNNFLQDLFEFLSINSGRFLKQLKLVVLFSNTGELFQFKENALRNMRQVYSLDLQLKVIRKIDYIRSIFDDSLKSQNVFLLYLENIYCLRISNNAPGLARIAKKKLKRLVSLQFSKSI